MLLLAALLVLTGRGEHISLISEIEIRGDLDIRQAPFLACWKDIGGGESVGGGVGSDGGGTDVSTFAGKGTTPDIE